MDIKLLVIFIVLNVLNVIIQTIKSIATVKSGKVVASIVNAVAYGLYTIVVVYTVCDLNLWVKVAVVAVSNLIGVYVVKLLEEKGRKDKLWKVEMTIDNENAEKVASILKDINVPCNYIKDIGKYCIVNAFCATKQESEKVKTICNDFGAKYFVTESKNL